MNQRPRIVLLAVATVIVLAFALAVLLDQPAPRSAAGTSSAGAGASVAENARSSSGFDGALLPPTEAGNFTLTDQLGRRVSLSQYRGRVTVLTFLSSACHPTCPLIAQQIRGALDELGEAGGHTVPVLIVSADPAADTPADVRRFLSEASLNGRVEYLTGTRTELQPIWRAYDIVPAQLGNANSPHAASVLLIDRAGQKRDLFQVEQLTPEALAHDIRKLDGDPTHP
jgi:protein SCO1/2